MTLIDKIESIRRLWGLMLPHVPAPSPAWMGRWAESAPDTAIEKAIVRASKVFAPERNDAAVPEAVHRYCTGVIRRETEQSGTNSMKGENETR